MNKSQIDIPLDIQLEAICFPKLRQTWEFLLSYIPDLKAWNPAKDSNEIIRQIIRDHMGFDVAALISYLQNHPTTCKTLLLDSYDKHTAPSTFIDEFESHKYRVGRTSGAVWPVRIFSSFAEATADYVLFSCGLPRLTTKKADWYDGVYC